ncbi:YdgH/BhsA/McbA-like domain containing protein [Pantoea sp. App145]|uniref:YdgH/BhsA/McbA-like domain containing protein n=1 Tax=Pantoea sp. App145 TaxID=3071567 RepID=UPI003A804819
MTSIKKTVLASVAAIAFVSFGSFAQSITAIDSTIDGAEAQIAEKAQQKGMHYRITEASNNNYVHMTAELYK